MITLYAIIALFAIVFQAFFTASEMAFTAVNAIKVRELARNGNKRAKRLRDYLSNEGAFLGTTLVGTNISVIIAAALATRIFAEYFPAGYSPVIVTAVMVPVTLIFAEIIPKIIAHQFATAFAMNILIPLRGFGKLFRPVVVVVNSVAHVLLYPFKGKDSPWDLSFTKSDLKSIIHFGHETGDVEKHELELMHKVLDFGSRPVSASMIPLYRVSSVGVNDSVRDLKEMVALTGFSRVPVYRDTKNNIIGTVNIYDVLFSMDTNIDSMVARDFIREAVHVRKKDNLDIALARLRHRKQPMGIVLDDDDKVVGIITIEDMLEELVGNIEDR